ncbi:redoxin domain-containing protein [Achromobacter sp. Marseille-Q0513]|uniref:cytochrome c biogenesis protein DipZ n=1 Tax=Achromobacter sp. Marseille-Q0513 TaxID=2829161 RepID=UPI001B932445|nr:cytochrome c biogenesis protein CcdA [Achromobacter sp. Marseille-Q0513]MBR8652723.1 redoxin domain-containing protein [Achromobacter sp. Marseille-Q0513]
MLILLVAFIGGILTIVSPCILPILPFVFARGSGSFRTHALPLLASMAVAFAAVASLAAVGGSWVVTLNEGARHAAMGLLALFGLALLLPTVSDWMSRPLLALGKRLTDSAPGAPRMTGLLSIGVGIGTGLLWAPCAGPILGLLLTGAALNGANIETSLLLLSFACGAALALAAALWLGRRMAAALRRVVPLANGMRRLAGAAVLAGVALPALGWNPALVSSATAPGIARLEQQLIAQVRPSSSVQAPAAASGPLAALPGTDGWLNSPPLDAADLEGKIVLVDFWTYSCINCLRTLPYLKTWHEKYKDAGLTVIGVHAPEFAFERRPANVRQAVADLGIRYPVAQDNAFKLWRAFHNQSWPAFYLLDGRGRLRYAVAGEHDYARTERMIQDLLAQAGRKLPDASVVTPEARGVEAPPQWSALHSGESYLGHDKASDYAPGATPILPDRERVYAPAAELGANQWTLAGSWRLEPERAVATESNGRIIQRFRARDLHMVLGPSADGRPLRFRVTLDGRPPLADHGTDINAQGEGVIDRQKLYQLIRQQSPDRDRVFQIEFLDPGVEAYAFTFG